MKTPVSSANTSQSNDITLPPKESSSETKEAFSDILSNLSTDVNSSKTNVPATPSQTRKRKIEDSINLINDAKEFKVEDTKQEDISTGGRDLDPLQLDSNSFMQPHNQVYVFSSKLANQAAEAVMSGKCSSIVDYHRSLPSTTQFLSNMVISGNRLSNPPVEWQQIKSETQIKNPNMLTPEQLRKRHENLAKLKGIGEMLNVLPQNGTTRSRSKAMNPTNDPMMMMGNCGPSMSPGVMMMHNFDQNEFVSPECNNSAAQLDWQRLQADFFEKRAKEQMNIRSERPQPFSSTEMEARMICKVGQPEHFVSSEMILRKAASKGCEVQTTPSPQQMNYSDIEGQELVITKQLNRSFKNSVDSGQQMTAPLSSMLQMTNNIPKPANSFNIRRSSPVLSSSKLIEKSTPPPPQRIGQAIQRLDYMPKSGMNSRFIDDPVFLDRQHQSAPAAINNTYVNATMSIQQLNIQSVAAPQSNAPFTANMQMQQQNAHLNAHQEFLNETNDLRQQQQQQQLLMMQQQRGARFMPPGGMQRFRPDYDFIPNNMRKQFIDGSMPQSAQQQQLAMMMGGGMQRMPYSNFMDNVGPGRPQYECFGDHMMNAPPRGMELSSFIAPQQQDMYQSMDNMNEAFMFPGENSPQMLMYNNGSKCNPIRGPGLMSMNNPQILTNHPGDPIFPPLDSFSNVSGFHNQSGFGETYGPPKGLL